MATVSKVRERVKPVRKIRLSLKPFENNPGVVNITVGKTSTDYFITPVPSDFGKAFQLEKVGGGETYQVNIDGESKQCCCKGFLGRYGGKCKHTDGLAALIQLGKL